MVQTADQGADVNLAAGDGKTPLNCLPMPNALVLASDIASDIAKLLIDGEGDPKITDNDGNTPLVCANQYV